MWLSVQLVWHCLIFSTIYQIYQIQQEIHWKGVKTGQPVYEKCKDYSLFGDCSILQKQLFTGCLKFKPHETNSIYYFFLSVAFLCLSFDMPFYLLHFCLAILVGNNPSKPSGLKLSIITYCIWNAKSTSWMSTIKFAI